MSKKDQNQAPEIKLFPKVIKRWGEPITFRRYRLKTIRNNQMSWQLHAWLFVALSMIIGSVIFLVLSTDNRAFVSDRAVICAILGFVLLILRFAPNLLSFIPVFAFVREDGFGVVDNFPPLNVYWTNDIFFNIATVELDMHQYQYIDLVYNSANGGKKRSWIGLKLDADVEEITQLFLEKGAQLHEDLEEFVPVDLVGEGEVLQQEVIESS